ncbi:homoserine kinase [Thalassotalea aquiviva]|uniref:homoserine kinase n=1 Tax=Thalassotalea aquiviva TaxID=3242415 RepID=UPI00352B03C2
MTLKVFAPASIGNVSVGFDVLGMAVQPISGELLGDVVSIKKSHTGQNELSVRGEFADKLPQNSEQNIVWQCMLSFNQKLVLAGKTVEAVSLELDKKMPVGSGLGSSACSVVAALVALNEYYQKVFTKPQLLHLMGQMEAKISGSLHYDNVAPCYLGGMQMMVSDKDIISQSIPPLKNTYWLMAYPGIKMSTKEARDVLPSHYSRSDLIKFGQSLASFIDACHRGNNAQALSYIEDVVAEPYRATLLPKFSQTKHYLLQHGAKAAGISGSGPTLFAVCDDLSIAQTLCQYLEAEYLQSEQGFLHTCQIDMQGARVIEE